MKHLVRSSVFVAALVPALVASACAPSGYAAITTPAVSYPAVPAGPATTFDVSASSLGAVPCVGCSAGASAVPFVSGRLPLGSMDALASGAGSPRALLGNQFQSGYWGGVRVRDLGGLDAFGASGSPLKPVFDAVSAGGVVALDRLNAPLLAVAGSGEGTELANGAMAAAVLHVVAAGFQRGLIEAALAQPPAGVGSPSATSSCAARLVCRVSGAPSSALDALGPVAAALEAPTSVGWFLAAGQVNQIHDQARQAGASAWASLRSRVPASGTSAFDEYVRLVGSLMEMNQVAALTALVAVVDGDQAAARRAVWMTAAWTTRVGGLVLGLASTVPRGTFPALR